MNETPSPLGLYVHVPFCPARCSHCAFAAFPYRPERVGLYLRSLAREMELAWGLLEERGKTENGLTVYFGGGTPTVLREGELGELLEMVLGFLRHRRISPLEVTVEANPETVTGEKLRLLRSWGVDRLSLGVQSFDLRLLRLLRRRHTGEEAVEAFREARKAGFLNISLDLLFGLPGQTLEGWRTDLLRALDLYPEHLSAYWLEVEEETLLGYLAGRGRLPEPLPSEEEQAEMYFTALRLCASAGYEHYEISNFARPGWQCRHNLIYWHNGEYLGLGPSAHSRLGAFRWRNYPRLEPYHRALGEGRLPVEGRECLDSLRDQEDTVVLGLRLREGVGEDFFRKRHGLGLEEAFGPVLLELLARGWLELSSGRLRLPEDLLPVAHQVLVHFVSPGRRQAPPTLDTAPLPF